WNLFHLHQLDSFILYSRIHDNRSIYRVTGQEWCLHLMCWYHIKQHAIAIMGGFQNHTINKLIMKGVEEEVAMRNRKSYSHRLLRHKTSSDMIGYIVQFLGSLQYPLLHLWA